MERYFPPGNYIVYIQRCLNKSTCLALEMHVCNKQYHAVECTLQGVVWNDTQKHANRMIPFSFVSVNEKHFMGKVAVVHSLLSLSVVALNYCESSLCENITVTVVARGYVSFVSGRFYGRI